jgi:LPXTG-motif cell wall-anchored protein
MYRAAQETTPGSAILEKTNPAHRHGETHVRIIRPVLLCTLLVGMALTLALGSSVVRPGQAIAQTGYGDMSASGMGSDTIPPRSLTIGTAITGMNPLLIAALIIAALIAGAGVVWWRRRAG